MYHGLKRAVRSDNRHSSINKYCLVYKYTAKLTLGILVLVCCLLVPLLTTVANASCGQCSPFWFKFMLQGQSELSGQPLSMADEGKGFAVGC